MNDALRLALLLVIAGLVLTGAGALIARWLDPRRRLMRFLNQALAAHPEGVLMDPGDGRCLAFNLDAGKIAVLWDKGRKGYVYRLDQLLGAEMMVDNTVLVRAHRTLPFKPLDEIPQSVHRAVLRLIFDNPRDPEFELELWPANTGRGREHHTPADAIQAGRRWLSALESIVRRPAPRTLTKLAPLTPILPDEDEPPPWDDHALDFEDDQP
jgi:hypothetical protein